MQTTAHIDYISQLEPHIYDKILDMLYEDTMAIIRQLSRFHNGMVSGYFYARFLRIVVPFGLDGKKLLRLMSRSQSIISGSAALLMLHPGAFIPGDLDIYVTAAEAVGLVMDLISSTPYEFSKTIQHKPCDYKNTGGIRTVHWLAHATLNKEINIIVVTGKDPLMTVMQFDATHVMNFITPTGFGCAYPRLTMAKLGLVNALSMIAVSKPNWVKKYDDRRFRIEHKLGDFPRPIIHQCTINPSCPQTPRHTRDAHMMYFDFKIHGEPIRHALHEYRGNVLWGLMAACGIERGQFRKSRYGNWTAGYVYEISM